MFEWLQGVQEYFNQVGSSIDSILADLQTLIDNLNAYITFSTYYIFASGFLLVIMFFMLCAVLHNQSVIVKQNADIMGRLDGCTAGTSDEASIAVADDAEIRRLLVLSKSNSPYQAKMAKDALAEIYREQGERKNE